MTQKMLLQPPGAFLAVFLGMIAMTWCLSKLAFRRKKGVKPVSDQSYACGENFTGHFVQPDYSQFFPFAYFFTILHVVVLMIATVPAVSAGVLTAAGFYILGAATGLVILLRK